MAVRQLTQEEKIRQQCEVREDYYRRTTGREELLKETTEKLEQALAENAHMRRLLKEHDININKSPD